MILLLHFQDHSEPKVVPTFDSYIVEEEEGSGNGSKDEFNI